MPQRRSTAQRTRDRRNIGNLYLQGWIQADIAESVGVSQSTVSNDLKALHKDWLASALLDFNEAKSQELAKIDRLEREYWAAWGQSKVPIKTASQKQRGKVVKRQDEDGEFIAEQPAEVSKMSKEQIGDPRFLAGVQWCIDRRCKILGVDAPVKSDIGGTLTVEFKGNINPDAL